ncbi:hypothetical protein HLB23_38695 [Nocardia uniformis]|uniref:Uncharacterized protein n=1 Tax=Nocardia uniformis TaxID=53432 RepID=A0A849CFY7_9NOCA|nr:hypothetical protein [Nocardia uniformis]NNH75715.1 hypothetical protein [Nocardia uniformis]
MRDLLRLAAHVRHYLVVFDHDTERPIYLGRRNGSGRPISGSCCTPAISAAPSPAVANRGICAKPTTVANGSGAGAPMPIS